jgi:hypothetical protein
MDVMTKYICLMTLGWLLSFSSSNTMNQQIAYNLRRTSLKWLEYFFMLLFVTLAVWYLFRWWAAIPGTFAALVLVRSINTSRVATLIEKQQ